MSVVVYFFLAAPGLFVSPAQAAEAAEEHAVGLRGIYVYHIIWIWYICIVLYYYI